MNRPTKLVHLCLSAAVCLSLWGNPPAARADDPEPIPVFINGVQFGGSPALVGEQIYYPAEELARAMGASLQAGPNGYTLNGIPAKIPPLLIQGKPYMSVMSAAQTVGAAVVKDPVRKMISVTCNMQSVPGGIPYYAADYRTPQQQAQDEHEANLNATNSPGDVWLGRKRAEMEKLYPKTIKVLDRVPEPIDFKLPEHPWSSANPLDPYTMPDGTPKPPPMSASVGPPATYNSRMCENGIYRVSVSDVKISEALKGISPDLVAPAGSKYVVIFLTEENQSKGHMPTAWFALRDANGNQFVGDYGLSQFSRADLRSRESSQGFVIFQIPVGSAPSALEVLCSPPLSLSLVLGP